MRLRTRLHHDVPACWFGEVLHHLGPGDKTGIDGTEIRARRPAAGRKDREKCTSGKSKQNTVKSMALTDGDRRVLCSPTRPGSYADITHARQSGWSNSWPTDPPWRFSPMTTARGLARRPMAGW